MDIGRAITFFTEDEHWVQKVSIGTGVVLISAVLSPILIGFLGFLILGGYAIRLLQNVRDGRPQPLPEWNEWGGDLGRGFKYVIVTLVWSLAAYLMMVPMVIGGALTESGDAGAFIGSAIMICSSCLLMLYGIFVALIAPGFTISFAHDEHIGSGLKVTKIWQWTRANLGQVIIVMLVVMAVSFIVSILAGIVGLILCGIGLLITIPFSLLFLSMFQYNLYGQLAREHPMYDSPGVLSAPKAPLTPDQAGEIVPGAEVSADESGSTIVPPAPADETGDSAEGLAARSVDEVAPPDLAATAETVTESVTESVEMTSTESVDEVEAIISEVSETGDEITANVDDIVEAGATVADVTEEVVDLETDDAGSTDVDTDPAQKPET